jgi:ribonuclease HII
MAGVIPTEETIKNWKKMGVKDSKLISLKKRIELEKRSKKVQLNSK